MALSGAVTGFTASGNGFRFTNSFPPDPTITIDLGPAGSVGLGNASQGVCGGMAFAVRDYFEAKLPVPPDVSPPGKGTALFDWIVKRLFDSFDLPSGVAKYALWMAMPSADMGLLGLHERGTGYRTVHESWPAIKADIDAGHPSPLGLVTVHTSDITKIGKCHQVLAYGYQVDDSNTLTLSIYDPNTPNDRADSVWIKFPLDGAEHGIRIDHTVNIGETTLHGLFRSEYSAAVPPTEPAG